MPRASKLLALRVGAWVAPSLVLVWLRFWLLLGFGVVGLGLAFLRSARWSLGWFWLGWVLGWLLALGLGGVRVAGLPRGRASRPRRRCSRVVRVGVWPLPAVVGVRFGWLLAALWSLVVRVGRGPVGFGLWLGWVWLVVGRGRCWLWGGGGLFLSGPSWPALLLAVAVFLGPGGSSWGWGAPPGLPPSVLPSFLLSLVSLPSSSFVSSSSCPFSLPLLLSPFVSVAFLFPSSLAWLGVAWLGSPPPLSLSRADERWTLSCAPRRPRLKARGLRPEHQGPTPKAPGSRPKA